MTQVISLIRIPLGLILAGRLGFVWLLSLVTLACLNLRDWDTQPGSLPAVIGVAIRARTLLHTGLFIITHDTYMVCFPARPGLIG
jgi:hypothetical protein